MRENLRAALSPPMLVALAALFVALGGTTWAATGGSFVLGKPNTADATTSLTAPVAGGRALQLTNTDTTQAGSTALGLTVGNGHPPLSVNSSVKVTNLNADLLDGINSAGFLRSTGKAADSNLLDGVDSTSFLRTSGKAADADKLDGVDSTGFLRSLFPLVLSGAPASPQAVVQATNNGSGLAVKATSGNSSAVYASSSLADGVQGDSAGPTPMAGVAGRSTGGGYGVSGNGQTGVYGNGLGNGVEGHSSSSSDSGVYGQNDGAGFGVAGRSATGVGVYGTGQTGVLGQSASGNAVEGKTTSSTSSGVYGENNGSGVAAFGVAGRAQNGVAVLGDSATGWAFQANGNATQNRSGGGFTKAMALIDPKAGDPIRQCYNSQLPSSQATNGDCGLTFLSPAPGVYTIGFGFQVDDRFVSVIGVGVGVSLDRSAYGPITTNQWNVVQEDAVDFGNPFFIIVY